MMSIKQKLTGKPSIDRPWMQYYPQEMIKNLIQILQFMNI